MCIIFSSESEQSGPGERLCPAKSSGPQAVACLAILLSVVCTTLSTVADPGVAIGLHPSLPEEGREEGHSLSLSEP